MSKAVKELNRKELRKLNDIECSNKVISHYMSRLIKKYPNFSQFTIDCYTHGNHYTKFELINGDFVWYSESKDNNTSISEHDVKNDIITSDELHKLLLFTYRPMCDAINCDIEFIDTPEDILAYAENKLKELLADE